MVLVVLVIAYVLYNIMRHCGTYSLFFGSYSSVGFGWRKRSYFDSATRSMALMRAADIRADGVVRGCRSQREQGAELTGGNGGQHGASRWPEGEVRSAGIIQG